MHRYRRLVSASISTLALCATMSVVRSQDHDTPERTARIFDAVGAKPGAIIADVGAGDGSYTVKLAPLVGPVGRVVAVDISASALERLRERARTANLSNIETIEGAVDDPRIPAASVDGVIVIHAYHEMTEFAAMLVRMRAALKPGGRLVIVEPISEKRRSATRAEQAAQHQLAPEHVRREVVAAGFTVLRIEDPIQHGGTAKTHDHDHDDWMLVASPGSPSPTTSK